MKGFLIVNEYKENDKHPDFIGTVRIGAADYRLAGWDSTSKSGKSYIRIEATLKGKASIQDAIDKEKNHETT